MLVHVDVWGKVPQIIQGFLRTQMPLASAPGIQAEAVRLFVEDV